MFYSKYSNYQPNQIITDSYQELCNEILNLVADKPDLNEKISQILYHGGYDDFSVNSNVTRPDNPFSEQIRRTDIAYILATNPEFFNLIEKDNATLFHGTNSNALLSILNHGMCSVTNAMNNNIPITTGEEFSRINGKRDFISFTDNLRTAINYSSISPLSKSSEESFRNDYWNVCKRYR